MDEFDKFLSSIDNDDVARIILCLFGIGCSIKLISMYKDFLDKIDDENKN